MKTLLSISAVALCFCAGCGSPKITNEPAYKPVPGPSNQGIVIPRPVYSSEPEKAQPPQKASAPPAAAKEQAPQKAAAQKPIVTPDRGLVGKVESYVEAGRFVVLGFSEGKMPRLDERLSVYRNGLKVGEVKVTGPQRGTKIVADLTTGEAAAGDEVK